MNIERIQALLTAGIADVSIEQLGEATYRVLLPTYRNTHDTIALGITEREDGWTLSDGGQLSYLLDDDFEKVVDAMECAGAMFQRLTGSDLTMEVEHPESLVSAVLGFGYYLGAAPAIWHTLECAKGTAEQKPTSADLMAKETRQRLIARATRPMEPYIHLKHPVNARGEKFNAPLAVTMKGARRPPVLLASFIDTSASAQAVVSAKKNTAFLWELARDWHDTRRYVVVRGVHEAVEHYAEFYDEGNINTVSTDDLGTLPQDVDEAITGLVGAARG